MRSSSERRRASRGGVGTPRGYLHPVPRSARWNPPRRPAFRADEGDVVGGRPLGEMAARTQGGTDGDAETEELLGYGEEPRSRRRGWAQHTCHPVQ